MAADEDILDLVVKRLKDARADHAHSIAEVEVNDFLSYKKKFGVLRGLDAAIGVVEQIQKEMETDDD